MLVRISEELAVRAPVERTWRCLADHALGMDALPGLELRGGDATTGRDARLELQVGAMAARYRGLAQVVERDDRTRHLQLSGDGREVDGSGALHLVVDAEVRPREDGGSDVRFDAEIDIVGRLVQQGRGALAETLAWSLRTFADALRARIESDVQVPPEVYVDEAPGDAFPIDAPIITLGPRRDTRAPREGRVPHVMEELRRRMAQLLHRSPLH